MNILAPYRSPLATGEPDPLDLHIQQIGTQSNGWTSVSSQASLLLAAGIALGPQGLALLTPDVLALLKPAVPVALALIGALTIFGRRDDAAPFDARPGVVPSAAIVLVGLALSFQQHPPSRALVLTGQACAIAIVVAGAGWILTAGDDDAEESRRVFWIATLLLLGGVAEYLTVSGLLVGWIAAGTWTLLRRRRMQGIAAEAVHFQHPIVALLLVIAGATAHVSWRVAAAAAALICLTALLSRLTWGRWTVRAGDSDAWPLAPLGFAIVVAMDGARGGSAAVASLLSVLVLTSAIADTFHAARSPDR
ncbi:MAG: hypothetical protein IT176_15155 [Acidobacteria bacterium]|nr:hypothetical protein [Acidobacteriota bacterium]